MALVLELPKWHVARLDNGTISCFIPPMSNDNVNDHYWFQAEVFKMREAWKPKGSLDNWCLHNYHNDSDFAYFKYFVHRRDALRALGGICREYMKLAQARYGGLLIGSLGEN